MNSIKLQGDALAEKPVINKESMVDHESAKQIMAKLRMRLEAKGYN
ncbi:hypothetical protein [Pararcticibacter amylolyticus]|nr:hypothetical protein [Pararcticibacter amylolyticus]